MPILPKSLRHVLALTLIAAPLAATAQDWSALRQLQQRTGASVTAAALDLRSGQTLQALNPQQRLNAASLSKLALAAAALETWDADRSVATEVYALGAVQDGRLVGELRLQGQGDATLEHRDLWLLAAQVRQSGIREVRGDLTVGTAPFGRLGCETKDRCDALARGAAAYAAPLSSLGVDYGSWCVELPATAAGATVRLRSCAGTALPIPVEGRIEARGSAPLWMERGLADDGELLRVGGSVQPGSEQRLYRSMADPALGAGLLLKQLLLDLGVKIEGSVRLRDEPLPANARRLAVVQGLPLREQLARLLRFSNNYIADMLTLAIARDRFLAAPVSLAQAAGQLSELVARARKIAGDGEVTPPLLLSGSGLTPENELSARDLVALLGYQYRNPRTFPVYYAGLVVPADAPGPRMRSGSDAWQSRVALKTGTMSVPHSVFGVAGYLRKQDGGWIAFAALVNGRPGRPVAAREALRTIRADVEELMTRY